MSTMTDIDPAVSSPSPTATPRERSQSPAVLVLLAFTGLLLLVVNGLLFFLARDLVTAPLQKLAVRGAVGFFGLLAIAGILLGTTGLIAWFRQRRAS